MSENISRDICRHILDLVYKEKPTINKRLNILNISYNISGISDEIKGSYRNTQVYNIELVRKPDETINKTLEFLYEEDFFDYIIFNDVLESLVEPWNVIGNIKSYLKKDGSVIVNVSNIMYAKTIESILKGTFTYLVDGEPSNKNLRCFSLLQMQQLFDYEGYNIDVTLAVKTKEASMYEELVKALCNITNKNYEEQYNSYNYIIKASLKAKKTLEDYVLNK